MFLKPTGKKGFTLIELLVVIAIIGILASVVLASLNSARRKSRDARRLADIKQLQVALELYFDGNSSAYPTALVLLTTGCSGGACIPAIPNNPQATAYTYTGAGTTYVLGDTLEETTNPALSNDIDLTPSAINCTDPIYCVRP